MGEGLQKESEEKVPNEGRLLRMDLASQMFDWKNGKFVGDDKVPLWVQLLLHIMLCASVIIIPIILYVKEVIPRKYPIFSLEPPPFYYLPLEIVRWMLFLASGYLGYILANVLIVTMAHLVYSFYRRKGREVTRKMQRRMDALLQLRFYISSFMGNLLLVVIGGTFFPLSRKEEINQELLQLFGIDAAAKIKKPPAAKGPNDEEAALAIAEYLREYFGHSVQFFVNRAAASLLVFTGFMLLEKLITQRIAFYFYHRSFGTRLDDNAFALKTCKRLKALILQRHPELTGADLATIIHSGCCPPHRPVLTIADIVAYIPAADAERLYQMMDVEATGEMALVQIQRAIGRFMEEQENMRLAMLDHANIIVKLDKLLWGLLMIIVLIIVLTLFQLSWQTVLAALAGITGILLVISSDTIKTAFGSIIFVIFTHPFDVGDRVIVGSHEYVVKELGLWTSVFEGAGNQLIYITNNKLSKETIVNARRSPFQSETFKINVLPNTTIELIKQLEAKLLVYLQQNAKDYVPTLNIGGFTIVSKDEMILEIPLTHRGNFQDHALRTQRNTNFMLYLKDALVECGIKLSPPRTR